MTSSASPTVRRRRLAAELRRLRGSHTGTTVAKALGWSPAKVSRYELGQGTFPLEEIEKLLDYYGVTDPRRSQLLDLAAEANERAWWEGYGEALTQEYRDFIGLEAEASSALVWHVEAIPGLLQTEEYARSIYDAHQEVILAFHRVYLNAGQKSGCVRQQVLTRQDPPPLELSAVIDESVLLRKVGSREIMFEQLSSSHGDGATAKCRPANPPLAAGIVANGGLVRRVRIQPRTRDKQAGGRRQH